MANTSCKSCGKPILVMAFRGEVYCSDSCKKALGLDEGSVGEMVLLSPEEKKVLDHARGAKLFRNGIPVVF